MNKEIKLIALDIDGTSMNEDGIISDYTRSIIQKIANNYILVPCSGRGFKGLVDETLKVEGIDYVVSANGAIVTRVKDKKKLFEALISYEIASSIIEKYTLDNGFSYVHCIDEDCTHLGYVKNKDVFDERYAVIFGKKYEELMFNDLPEKMRQTKMDVAKIGMRFPSIELAHKYKEIIENEYEEVNVFNTDIGALEITSKDASKGSSLKKLCEILNIDCKEVCAIGDNGNDISMIEFAKLGVAMGNALPEVKKVAKIITTTNNEDGAAHFLEDYLLGGAKKC